MLCLPKRIERFIYQFIYKFIMKRNNYSSSKMAPLLGFLIMVIGSLLAAFGPTFNIKGIGAILFGIGALIAAQNW